MAIIKYQMSQDHDNNYYQLIVQSLLSDQMDDQHNVKTCYIFTPQCGIAKLYKFPVSLKGLGHQAISYHAAL